MGKKWKLPVQHLLFIQADRGRKIERGTGPASAKAYGKAGDHRAVELEDNPGVKGPASMGMYLPERDERAGNAVCRRACLSSGQKRGRGDHGGTGQAEQGGGRVFAGDP